MRVPVWPPRTQFPRGLGKHGVWHKAAAAVTCRATETPLSSDSFRIVALYGLEAFAQREEKNHDGAIPKIVERASPGQNLFARRVEAFKLIKLIGTLSSAALTISNAF